ncbi:MAG: hypothetical protein AAGA84_11640 [Pseudomonadota bacterium]
MVDFLRLPLVDVVISVVVAIAIIGVLYAMYRRLYSVGRRGAKGLLLFAVLVGILDLHQAPPIFLKLQILFAALLIYFWSGVFRGVYSLNSKHSLVLLCAMALVGLSGTNHNVLFGERFWESTTGLLSVWNFACAALFFLVLVKHGLYGFSPEKKPNQDHLR